MSRTTCIRAFVIGAPLAFAALLTRHPMGGDEPFEVVSANVTAWLQVHYGSAVLFPSMALVVWLLIRDLPGRGATTARWALPVFAVFYTVWEAIFGIATGLIAKSAEGAGPAEREGAAEAVADIFSSPVAGEPSLLVAIGSIAWWTAMSGAIVALKDAGVRPALLALFGAGGLMVFHIPPIGPVALVCLSASAYLLERRREPASGEVNLATALPGRT